MLYEGCFRIVALRELPDLLLSGLSVIYIYIYIYWVEPPPSNNDHKE